jgi:PAS domain-containing protein
MPDPFSKGASVRIKIRTEIEFFQTDATVANATHGLGMEVLFRAVSPPFLLVLQHWLSEAQQRIAHHKIAGYSGREFAMEKKAYAPPRVVERLPDQVPKWIKDKFNEDSLSFASAYTTLIDGDRRYVQVSNAFCELLGYKSQELIGKRFDELTAPRTSDIPTIFGLFKKLGYMQGL